jgi:hypothetical protein
MCDKHGYKTADSARSALRKIKRKRARSRHQHHGGKVERRSYRCQECGRWHLTSQGYYE